MFSKYFENFVQIPWLDSEKPPTCHNGDTMCRTKNRIPKCTPQTITKFITKVSALTIKRSGQDTIYGARMQKYIKALILVLGLLQVVGTVKMTFSNGRIYWISQKGEFQYFILVLEMNVFEISAFSILRWFISIINIIGTLLSFCSNISISEASRHFRHFCVFYYSW